MPTITPNDTDAQAGEKLKQAIAGAGILCADLTLKDDGSIEVTPRYENMEKAYTVTDEELGKDVRAQLKPEGKKNGRIKRIEQSSYRAIFSD